MSLITNELLKILWELAQAQSSNEWASAKLWSYLWNKHLFAEKEWAVSLEPPPEGHGRRRVDITIEYFGRDSKLAVLAFHEAKALNGPRDVQDAEKQAFDTCVRYLGEHPELEFVYAFTSFGTEGRAWQCDREETFFTPLFGSLDLDVRSQYVELHSSEARLIRQAVQTMKAVPPSE